MAENHQNNIDPRPKRRKDKDNPYELFTVGIETDHPHYYMRFVDGQGVQICMEIEEPLFDLLDQFELDDLSHLNEVDRHYEQSELTEETLNNRALDKSNSLEEAALQNLRHEKLHKAILMLPPKQRKRLILYYFSRLTYQQIADLEGCAYQAIQKSVEKAEKKIKKILLEGGVF